jgi:hypothetical protein
LLVLWTLATIAAGVLTIDDPWWPRLLVMVPALCLLAAWAADACLASVVDLVTRAARGVTHHMRHRHIWRWRLPQRLVTYLSSLLLVLAVLGYSGAQSYNHYFRDYAMLVNTDSYRTRYTDLAYFAARLPPGQFVILFTEDDLSIKYATVAFLAPQVQGETVNTGSALLESLRQHPRDTIVIITPSAQTTFSYLLQTLPQEFPPGTYWIQPHRSGHQTLATYTTTMQSRIGIDTTRGRIPLPHSGRKV